MKVARVSGGQVVLQLAHAYEAALTLVPAPEPDSVRIRYSVSASQQQQQPSVSEQPSVQVRERCRSVHTTRLALMPAIHCTRRYCGTDVCPPTC